jgi:hypothetical protein
MADRRVRHREAAAERPRVASGPREAATRPDAGFRPWHFFVLASLGAATVAVALSHGTSAAHLVLMSLAIGAAGASGLACYRTIAPLLAADVQNGRGAVGTRSRVALEREKALVLRAIKELEFDRAMGKIAARDFDEMVARLRARAVALMKQLDQAGPGYRELIERELLARLGARPGPAVAGGPPRCAACGTSNDEDARFCKRCGARLEAASTS